jgi:hypothetical protein
MTFPGAIALSLLGSELQPFSSLEELVLDYQELEDFDYSLKPVFKWLTIDRNSMPSDSGSADTRQDSGTPKCILPQLKHLKILVGRLYGRPKALCQDIEEKHWCIPSIWPEILDMVESRLPTGTYSASEPASQITSYSELRIARIEDVSLKFGQWVHVAGLTETEERRMEQL